MLIDRYYAPSEQVRKDLEIVAQAENASRRKSYEQAVKYYDGKHPDQLPYNEGEADDNTPINLVKMAADRTATFLFRGVPKFKTDVRKVEQTEDEALLEDFLRFNGGLRFLQRLALSGFLSGHSFIRIIPKKKFDKYPRIQILNPMAVTIFWDIDNQTDVLWYEYRYTQKEVETNKEIEYIIDYVKVEGKTGYYWNIFKYKKTANWELVETGVHDDEIAPIVDIPHLPHPVTLYGVGEFISGQQLQNSINRIASQITGIIRENANPVDVLTGADVDDVDDNGTLITVPNPNARVSRLEMGGDVTKLQNILDERISLFLALMRVVLLKGEAKDLQRVTNASVRTLFLDMLAKNDILKGTYTKGLEDICALALRMLGKPKPEKITVIYTDPLPTDELEKAQINKILAELGARSLQTISEDMGDNWIEEKENMQYEYEAHLANTINTQKRMDALLTSRDTISNDERDAQGDN